MPAKLVFRLKAEATSTRQVRAVSFRRRLFIVASWRLRFSLLSWLPGGLVSRSSRGFRLQAEEVTGAVLRGLHPIYELGPHRGAKADAQQAARRGFQLE